jgi:hypothetical protein
MIEVFAQAIREAQRYKVLTSPQFHLEIEGAPDRFSTLIREVSVGGGSLDIEEIHSGSIRFALPRSGNVSKMEITCAMDADGVIFKYFRKWRNDVLDEKGLFGLPYGQNGFVRRIRLWTLDENYMPKNVIREIWGYPEDLGQVSFSVKNIEPMEMQVSLVQFLPDYTSNQFGEQEETATNENGVY